MPTNSTRPEDYKARLILLVKSREHQQISTLLEYLKKNHPLAFCQVLNVHGQYESDLFVHAVKSADQRTIAAIGRAIEDEHKVLVHLVQTGNSAIWKPINAHGIDYADISNGELSAEQYKNIFQKLAKKLCAEHLKLFCEEATKKGSEFLIHSVLAPSLSSFTKRIRNWSSLNLEGVQLAQQLFPHCPQAINRPSYLTVPPGKSELHVAIKQNIKMAGMLVQYGADIDAPDLTGRSPLSLASQLAMQNPENIAVVFHIILNSKVVSVVHAHSITSPLQLDFRKALLEKDENEMDTILCFLGGPIQQAITENMVQVEFWVDLFRIMKLCEKFQENATIKNLQAFLEAFHEQYASRPPQMKRAFYTDILPQVFLKFDQTHADNQARRIWEAFSFGESKPCRRTKEDKKIIAALGSIVELGIVGTIHAACSKAPAFFNFRAFLIKKQSDNMLDSLEGPILEVITDNIEKTQFWVDLLNMVMLFMQFKENERKRMRPVKDFLVKVNQILCLVLLDSDFDHCALNEAMVIFDAAHPDNHASELWSQFKLLYDKPGDAAENINAVISLVLQLRVITAVHDQSNGGPLQFNFRKFLLEKHEAGYFPYCLEKCIEQVIEENIDQVAFWYDLLKTIVLCRQFNGNLPILSIQAFLAKFYEIFCSLLAMTELDSRAFYQAILYAARNCVVPSKY